MSRPEQERLLDILAACEAIASYLERESLDNDVRFDAIRVRLIEIGEAVKDLSPETRTLEPGIPASVDHEITIPDPIQKHACG